MLARLLNNPLIKTQDNNAETVRDISEIVKGGEIRDTKKPKLKLSRNIVSLQVLVDVSRFFFSPCVINLSRNKNICCRLKKVVAKCRAQVNFEQQILALLLIFHQTQNL